MVSTKQIAARVVMKQVKEYVSLVQRIKTRATGLPKVTLAERAIAVRVLQANVAMASIWMDVKVALQVHVLHAQYVQTVNIAMNVSFRVKAYVRTAIQQNVVMVSG
jgi:hypothetical protein